MSATQLPMAERPQPSTFYRWLVLIFVSLAMFGNYYIYDSINPLERIFLEQLNYSASMFGWLNASYSVAAVATLLIVPGDDSVSDRFRATEFIGEAAVSAWNGFAVARFCAAEGAMLRRDLMHALAALGQAVPRLWLQ